MPGPIHRYGATSDGARKRIIAGSAYLVRARFLTTQGYYSPYSEASDFGVTQSGHIPVCDLMPLPAVIWDQPLSQWTWVDVDEGHVQDAYEVEIATDAAFTSIVDDSGVVASTALQHQHSGLAVGTYYRRARVRTNSIDWSDYNYDSFNLAAKTSQSVLVQLTRRYRDGIEAKVYVPISSPKAVRRYNGSGGFEFVIDNYYPWTERALVACHHFDELSGAVGHDFFGENHLVLTGAPAWTDGVLNLAGDDYGQSGALTLAIASDWTAYLAVLPSGASGCLWFLGGYADDANYYSIQANGAGKVRIVHAGGASADLTVAAASWVVLRIKRSGTTVTLTRLDTGASVTATITATGAARLAIGRYAGATPGSIIASAKISGHMLYSDDLTAAEDAINLDAYRSNLVHRSLQVL